MKSIKITFGPVPYFLMPRLLGTEHRKPAEVGRAEALPLRKRIICGEYHPPAIRFWKSYKFVLVPVRFFSEDNKVQKPFLQLFRNLLRVAAGDVVLQLRILLLQGFNRICNILDLIGFS